MSRTIRYVPAGSYPAHDSPILPKVSTDREVGFFRCPYAILKNMEIPNTENVAYLDEYPHLTERCRLRRLGRAATGPALILVMPSPLLGDPDFRSLMETPPEGSGSSA